MGRTIVLIGLGGFVGSVLRYLLSVFIAKAFPVSFPLGTMVVNVLGCLLIGVFCGLLERGGAFTASLGLLLITGFCGGFTTFSTFSFESVTLLKAGAYGLFILYALGSVMTGLLAVWAGLALTKG